MVKTTSSSNRQDMLPKSRPPAAATGRTCFRSQDHQQQQQAGTCFRSQDHQQQQQAGTGFRGQDHQQQQQAGTCSRGQDHQQQQQARTGFRGQDHQQQQQAGHASEVKTTSSSNRQGMLPKSRPPAAATGRDMLQRSRPAAGNVCGTGQPDPCDQPSAEPCWTAVQGLPALKAARAITNGQLKSAAAAQHKTRRSQNSVYFARQPDDHEWPPNRQLLCSVTFSRTHAAEQWMNQRLMGGAMHPTKQRAATTKQSRHWSTTLLGSAR